MRNASAFKNGSNPRSVSNVANDIKKLLNII
jgi:hypothetical protein